MTRQHVSHLRLSDAGRDVLADREGMRLTAYKDSVGIWTIGLGHTGMASPPKVHAGMSITEDEAWDMFYADAEVFRREARDLVKVPLEQHEFDALASFIFNIGNTAFAHSTVLQRLNDSNYDGAAEAIMMWRKPREVISRRKGEYEQFKYGRYNARVT